MRKELNTLTLLTNAVREIDDSMPIQTLSVLLEIARREPIGITKLSEHVGLAQSSASRNVAALSARHWLKRPGLCLVQLENDPQDIRKKMVTLTAKGRKAIEQLVDIIGSQQSPAVKQS